MSLLGSHSSHLSIEELSSPRQPVDTTLGDYIITESSTGQDSWLVCFHKEFEEWLKTSTGVGVATGLACREGGWQGLCW